MPLACDWDAGVILASGCDHRMLVATVAAAVSARQRCYKAASDRDLVIIACAPSATC